VKKKTLNPVWAREWMELRLQGGVMNEDGEYDNRDAPYTQLRLEIWDRDLMSRDDFIGEVCINLCPLMDGRKHAYTLPLTDPEGKCGADDGVHGTVSFEVQYES